jgi:hypothetical protein
MRKHVILLLATGLAFGAGIGGRESVSRSKIEAPMSPEILAAEYALAKNPHFYFVLDLKGGKLDLKVKGLVMKTWILRGTRFWGRPDFPATLELTRKSALRAPRRFEIKPAGEEADIPKSDPAGFELDALEVSDMPGGFALSSADGVRISVTTRAGSLVSGLGSILSFISWNTLIPVRHLFRTIVGKAGFAVELTFSDKRDAQFVYWTFFEGIKGLVY